MTVLPFPRPDAPVSALDGRCVAALFATPEGRDRVSTVGTLLVFPVTASRDQRLEEAACEVQSQVQRAGKKASEARRLLMDGLTAIVAQAWDGPVSPAAVGCLIRAERLLGRDAIPAIGLARQAAHELAGLISAAECEACDDRQAGRGRAANHGRSA